MWADTECYARVQLEPQDMNLPRHLKTATLMHTSSVEDSTGIIRR